MSTIPRKWGGGGCFGAVVECVRSHSIQASGVALSDGPLVDRLREISVEVQIIALPIRLMNTSRNHLGSVLAHPNDLFDLVLRLSAIERFMRRRDFDLVHTTSLKADILGGVAARVAGRRLVWHIHDRFAEDYLPRAVVEAFKMLVRWIPHRVIANSKATLQTLPLLASGRVRVVYPGVPQEFLQPVTSDMTDGVMAGPPVVGIVGRISPTQRSGCFRSRGRESRKALSKSEISDNRWSTLSERSVRGESLEIGH